MLSSRLQCDIITGEDVLSIQILEDTVRKETRGSLNSDS